MNINLKDYYSSYSIMRYFIHWVINFSLLALFRQNLQYFLQVTYLLFDFDVLLLLRLFSLQRIDSMISCCFTFDILNTLVGT